MIFKISLLTIILTEINNGLGNAVGGRIAEEKALSQSISTFTLKLNDKLSKHAAEGENILFSPINVYVALAMAHAASDGVAKQEIAAAMGLPNDPDVSKDLGVLLRSIQNTLSANVNLASGAFVQENLPGREGGNFLNDLTSAYDGEFVNVDFRNPEMAKNVINSWTSEKTNGKIPKLYENILSSNTKLVLTSALYFSGKWQNEFNKEETKWLPFKTANSIVGVEMMTTYAKILHARSEEDRYEAIGIPYANQTFYLYIVLPEDVKSFAKKKTIFQDVLKEMSIAKVRYTIPKMSLKWKKDLKQALYDMGVHKILDGNAANFPKVAPGPLGVQKMTHSVKLEVDEKGSRGSAATSVNVETLSLQRSETFVADKPFVFFIHHQQTDTVIFMGTVYKPEPHNKL